MITLITGTPGSCKTLSTVCMLRDWLREQDDAERAGAVRRRVFVHGVPQLTLPHEVAEDPAKWHEWLPDGALLIVDECQDFWRPRASSSAVPVSVQAMEKHRHRGIDIWLITQHPNLIDPNIRRLIRRHIHFRVNWAGRWRHEGAEVFNVDQAAARKLTATTKYKMPKDCFALYKSAEIHTKTPLSVPRYVYVAVVAALGAVGIWFYFSHVLAVKTGLAQGQESTPLRRVVGTGSIEGVDSGGSSRSGRSGVTAEEYARASVPRVAGLPYTAPKYDQATTVTVAPRPAICVQSKRTGCKCYTQQGTLMADFLPTVCESIVAHGWFQEWADGQLGQVQQPQAVQRSAVVSDSRS